MACEKVKKLKVQFCRYYFTFTTKDRGSEQRAQSSRIPKKVKKKNSYSTILCDGRHAESLCSVCNCQLVGAVSPNVEINLFQLKLNFCGVITLQTFARATHNKRVCVGARWAEYPTAVRQVTRKGQPCPHFAYIFI